MRGTIAAVLWGVGVYFLAKQDWAIGLGVVAALVALSWHSGKSQLNGIAKSLDWNFDRLRHIQRRPDEDDDA